MNISCVHDDNGNLISREDESGTPSSGQQVTVSITATPVQAPAAGNTVLITASPVLLTNCTDYTWDVENRLTAVTGGASFVYDGDGSRVKKTENGETILYVNRFYEKNLTTGVVTTYYYLGLKLIAQNKNDTLQYFHQDSLGSTSVVTGSSGTQVSSVKYLGFGMVRSGTVSNETDIQFTGQKKVTSDVADGLYYYNARYYDADIGRFISPDIYVQDSFNPQCLNRYSYVINNPLKYTDPSGHFWDYVIDALSITFDIQQMMDHPSWENAGYLVGDVILGIVPFIPAGVGPVVKGIKAVDKTIESAKTSKQLTKYFKSFTENNFRYNLKTLTGKSDEVIEGMQAHHVLPIKNKTEFKKAGLNINDPKFGSWVDSSHQNWSKAYNDEWDEFFMKNNNPTQEQILNKARELADKYKFKVEF